MRIQSVVLAGLVTTIVAAAGLFLASGGFGWTSSRNSTSVKTSNNCCPSLRSITRVLSPTKAFYVNVEPPPQGMCVKTHTEAGDKIFINICHTPELPAPEDISEDALVEIWTSDNHSSFRVPMSISEDHAEVDKAGNSTVAYDVAINHEFYKKIEKSKVFLTFLLTVVMEGVKNKYSLHLQTEDYVILKNRKVMGELLPHRIRQGGQRKPAVPLIQEMTPPIPVSSREPQYRIRHEPPQAETPDYLLAEFFMKDLTSSHGLTLDVGEDRIVLDSPGLVGKRAYKLDVFIPYSVDQDRCSASFNTDTKILTLKMPVIATN